jgi:hypothetical protein
MERLKTIEFAGLEWDILPKMVWEEFDKSYCCDGDGMVQVYEYASGLFEVADQGDVISSHKTLEEALQAATDLLKKDYTAIYNAFYCEEDN